MFCFQANSSLWIALYLCTSEEVVSGNRSWRLMTPSKPQGSTDEKLTSIAFTCQKFHCQAFNGMQLNDHSICCSTLSVLQPALLCQLLCYKWVTHLLPWWSIKDQDLIIWSPSPGLWVLFWVRGGLPFHSCLLLCSNKEQWERVQTSKLKSQTGRKTGVFLGFEWNLSLGYHLKCLRKYLYNVSSNFHSLRRNLTISHQCTYCT